MGHAPCRALQAGCPGSNAGAATLSTKRPVHAIVAVSSTDTATAGRAVRSPHNHLAATIGVGHSLDATGQHLSREYVTQPQSGRRPVDRRACQPGSATQLNWAVVMSKRCAGPTRQTARAARLSPTMALNEIAAATGVDTAQIRDALNAVNVRGVCARTAAALTGVGGGARLVGLAHRACPPAVTRLAAEPSAALSVLEVLALRGPARWAALPSLEATTDAERRVLAEHGGCVPKLVPLLARDDHWEVRAEVAANVSCDPELIVRLAQDNDEDVRAAAAASAVCGPNLIRQLAQDRHWEVRVAVAANVSCDPELIVRLAQDKDEDVRAAAASSAGCPADLISALAEDDHWQVRAAVATRVGCDPELIVRLAQDKDEDVRAAAVSSAGCPADLISALAEDRHWQVRAAVATRPSAATRS